jgi:predicted nucleic acid-binding protein
MKLDDALTGVSRLCLDTSPIIYFIEANPTYDARVTGLFGRIANGSITGLTSAISLTEVLVQPYLTGDAGLQQEYRNLLLGSNNFETLPIDVGAAERAADLRARYRLRTPDALRIAVALGAGCQAFLTNDTRLKRVTELGILVLDELEL